MANKVEIKTGESKPYVQFLKTKLFFYKTCSFMQELFRLVRYPSEVWTCTMF
jgi:hypothetical protein